MRKDIRPPALMQSDIEAVAYCPSLQMFPQRQPEKAKRLGFEHQTP